jgi:hypothetical protein
VPRFTPTGLSHVTGLRRRPEQPATAGTVMTVRELSAWEAEVIHGWWPRLTWIEALSASDRTSGWYPVSPVVPRTLWHGVARCNVPQNELTGMDL